MGHPLGGAARCPHHWPTLGWYRRPRGGWAHCDCVAAPADVRPADFQQGAALNAGHMLRSLERLTAAHPEHERYGIEVIGCQRCGDVWERRGAGRVLPASPDPDLVKRERR